MTCCGRISAVPGSARGCCTAWGRPASIRSAPRRRWPTCSPPGRLLAEPVRLASGREAGLTPARLRAMIDGYYAARGLDQRGRPDAAQLTDLRLS